MATRIPFLSLGLPIVLLSILGCTGAPSVSNSDPTKAKEIAITILDAWKQGETMESLKQKTPPMFAVIDLWKDGSKLNSYEIIGEGEMVGPNIRFQVRFNCQDKAGKKVDKTIKYLVTTTPAITFIKEDG
ncbi:MAG: hypothetical protein ACK5YR_20440 [Pirellula sp.]